MALGCGAPPAEVQPGEPVEETSGAEERGGSATVHVHSAAELRAAARADRLEAERAEGERLKSRLAGVHAGTPYHEALLLLGIDETHILVRGGRDGFVGEYGVADYTIEFLYSRGEEPLLYAAVMYQEGAHGSERQVVAEAVAAVELGSPEVDAQIATMADLEFTWSVAVPSAVTLKICTDAACHEAVWTEVVARQVRRGRVRPADLVLPAGVYFWRVEIGGRPTSPRRFYLGATGPAFAPIGAESTRDIGEPHGRPVRVRFRRGPLQWGAQLMGCADESCLLLALGTPEESRFLVVSEDGVAIEGTAAPRLKRLFLPDRSQALLIAFEHEVSGTPVREAWVVADDGEGPRVIWKGIIHAYACAGEPTEGGEPCQRVRVRERLGFRDRDRDGVAETLVLTRIVGGRQSEERVERDAEGRFPLTYSGRLGFDI